MIPQSYIDEVLARVNIVDIIDARVKLKKAGKNHTACCPFHDEKSPSFSVTEEKGFYYCFGCGASGNAIGFLMDYERLDFKESVVTLGRSLGLGDPQTEEKVRESFQSRFSRYTALKRQILFDDIFFAIFKTAREKGEPIPESDKPLMASAMDRLKLAREEIKEFDDVEIDIRRQNLRNELIDAHMTLICRELQEDRELHLFESRVPTRIDLVTDTEVKIAKNRVEKLSKAIG